MYDVLGVLRLSLSTLGKVHEATFDFGKFLLFDLRNCVQGPRDEGM